MQMIFRTRNSSVFCSASCLRKLRATSRRSLVSAQPQCSMQKAHEYSVKSGDHRDDSFNYTSGRWLFNEKIRLVERQLYFNPNELRSVVAKSVGVPDGDIEQLVKIAEGGSYRIFEATFRQGLKVIARLPYPCIIPHEYGIASEVATMEFLRLHGVPVPKIFAWSSSPSNPVGCEYIIMEKVLGKELEDVWYTMTMKERMAVVEKIVKIEKILFDMKFPAIGSLFFKESLSTSDTYVDMPKDDNLVDMSRFCIGPSTEYLWWYRGRDKLAINHGPWRNTSDLMKAVGERELVWLRKFGRKRYPRETVYKEFYDHKEVDPEAQMNYLSAYLKLVPLIVPEESELNKSTIRHPDLSPTNIFISDSGDITGIIDWQHSVVLPIFLQAKIPKHFQNYGDDDSENFRPPKLVSNFTDLSEPEQQRELELYRRRQVHYFYLGFTNRFNEIHFDAMGKYSLVLRNQLYDIAGRPWEGDNTSLQAGLINTLSHWSEIASPPCDPPIQFSESEIKTCLDRDAKQKNADVQLQKLREFIGINIEGWVPVTEFDTAKSKAKYIQGEMLEALETEKEKMEFKNEWPFQDHEEID